MKIVLLVVQGVRRIGAAAAQGDANLAAHGASLRYVVVSCSVVLRSIGWENPATGHRSPER
jgi:hypothetical protein